VDGSHRTPQLKINSYTAVPICGTLPAASTLDMLNFRARVLVDIRSWQVKTPIPTANSGEHLSIASRNESRTSPSPL
jgi:hypothetical protein